MTKADRIKEKRGPGSRIEKNVARCPECSRIIQLKGTSSASGWRSVKVAAAGGIMLVVVVGVAILVWLIRM
jgi:hypothetical protein